MAAVAMTMASAVAPTIANASTLTVTNTADSGAGSLRDVLAGTTNGDTVTFAPSATGVISLASPITIDTAVTIIGPGASVLTLDGQNKVQDLVVDSAASAVAISGVTLTRGSGLNGGAIDSDAALSLSMVSVTNSAANGNGGGIYSEGVGSLTVVNSTVSGNTAYAGGGIYALVPGGSGVVIQGSTISGNAATGGEGAGIAAVGQSGNTSRCGSKDEKCCDGECCDGECCDGECGCPPICDCLSVCSGVRSDAVPTSDAEDESVVVGAVRIARSTVAANKSPSGAAIDLDSLDSHSAVISSTIAANTGSGLGAGLNLTPPDLAADIIAGNTQDCASDTWNDFGYNVDGDGSCGLSGAGSESAAPGIASAVGALQGNGGPTQTMALSVSADPAHDVVPAAFSAPGESDAVCTLADQRGVVPANSPCDVGAYQLAGAPTITAHVSSDSPRSSYGWYHTAVTVAFTCAAGSPVLTVECPTPQVVTTEGKHTIVGTAVQQDGQTASVTRHIKIDETGPVVHAHDKRSYTSASFFTCSDALSGIASCTTHRKTLDDGTMKYKVVAIDKADNKTVRRGTFGDAFTSAG